MAVVPTGIYLWAYHNRGYWCGLFDRRWYTRGIRVYCAEDIWIWFNNITGNNHGVIIKDTAPGWAFLVTLLGNNIYSNTVGMKLQYGNNSLLQDNNISNNGTGVHLIDTWDNEISFNTIESNGTSFKLEKAVWDVNGNRIYANDIVNPVIWDNTDCLDQWYKRKTPTLYTENNCLDNPIQLLPPTACSADYYCNPIP